MDPSRESIVSVIDQCIVAAIAAKGEDETLKVLVEVGNPREMEVNVDGGALFDALNGGQLYCEFTRERLKDREKVIMERESAKAVVGGDLLTKEVCGAFHSLENVKGVARRRMDVQSEANEGRYPPLPPPSCSPSACRGILSLHPHD